MTQKVVYPRRLLHVVWLLLAVLVLSLGMVGTASAEGTPFNEVPNYPKYGCLDVVAAGQGMWSGYTPYDLLLDVPGPVKDAYLFWIGTADGNAANAPNESDLLVNGTKVIGTKIDYMKYLPSDPHEWYMWRANVTSLVKQGSNRWNITDWHWAPVPPLIRNGVTLVVVYETGACPRPNQVDLLDNMDFYWQGQPGHETSGPMTYKFPPAPVDRDMTVWLSFAGTDHSAIDPKTTITGCRPEQVWAATGSGASPATIINYGMPSVGVNGGQLAIANGAFANADCPGPNIYLPVTKIVGWVDGFGPKEGESGNIRPEWSLLKVTVKIPAGHTWLVLQGESVKVTLSGWSGESGAWFGQSMIPLYNPELKIAKTDGVAKANPGDTLIYTINYENYGYGPAENTTIEDVLPMYVTPTGANPAYASYDPATRKVIWNLGTVNNGVKGQVALTVKLDPVFEAGTTYLTNTVSIKTTTPGEQDLSDNSASDLTEVFAKVELKIKKTAAPEPVEAGAPLTFTIDWEVVGNAYAHDVMIVDTLPMTVTYDSSNPAGVYDPVKHTVTWSLGKVTPNKTGSYSIKTLVKTPLYNGIKLPNTVTISDKAGDKATSSTITTVHSDHVLSIKKVSSPEPVEAGANLTYTITWGVTGNEPSPNATIVDTLDPKVKYVSATGGGVYDQATHKITWQLGELMTPKNGQFVVVVTVISPQYNGVKATNVVNFKDDDPGTAPVQDTVVNTIHADHELTITKSGSPDPVMKGADLTYTIEWGVTGNEFADNVVVTDTLPFGTKFVSASGGGLYNAATGVITWNLGNKVPGDKGTLTLVVKVNKDFLNKLDLFNHVYIKDYKPGKEKDREIITKVVQTPEGSIGDTVWYDANGDGVQWPGEPGIAGVSLILYDAGPDKTCGTADDVAKGNTVTDAMGHYLFNEVAGGTYCVKVVDASVPPGLVLTGGTNPHKVTLAEGAEYRLADFGYGPQTGTGVIGDRVWGDANGNGKQDPGEVGIGGVTVDLLKAGPDGKCGTADDMVVATKTTGPDGSYMFTGVAPGKYCVKVTDNGNVLAGMTLTGGTNPHGPIDLAAGGTYLDADFGYRGGKYVGSIGDLVFYDANRNGVYEPGPAERGIPDVTLNLVIPGPDGVFGTADDLVVGSATTDNNGNYLFSGLPDGKYRVVVTDVLGRLPGYTQTYGVPNTNNNGQGSPYEATITGGNSVLTADFGYADGHLLDVVKFNNVPAGQRVEAGAQMVYTINWSVSGRPGEIAQNVIIRDALPFAQVEYVSSTGGGVYDAATKTVTWSLGNKVPGDTGSVTVTVKVKKPLPNNSFIFNTAIITDDAKVTDEATDIVQVHAEPILSLTKTNKPTGEVKPGDTIEYTLCFANTGNGNATGVVLSDVVPVNTTVVVSSLPPGVIYNDATRTLMLPIGVLPPDAALCGSFQVKVNMTIVGLTGQANVPLSFAEWNALTIDNVAVLKSNELPDKTAKTSNPLNATVKPEIFKTVNLPVVHMGEAVVFTVTVANKGTANATNVIVTDAIHPKLEYVTLTSSKGTTSYDAATQMWTVNIGILAPNETVTIVISGLAKRVDNGDLPYKISNTAQVKFTEGAPRNSNEVLVDVVYFLPGEVPEASTLLMLGSGLAGLAGYRACGSAHAAASSHTARPARSTRPHRSAWKRRRPDG